MSSKLRILHACPQGEIFDFLNNDCLLCQKVAYKDCTEYYEVISGDQNFKICKPQKHYYPLVNGYTYLPDNSYHTLIASGKTGDLSLFVVPDAHVPIISNKAFIRFVNLAPDSPTLKFTFTDDAFVMVDDIEYKEVTQYYPVTPSTYTMKVRLAATDQVILTIYNVTLRSERFYTIYILGMVKEYPAPTYLICADGNSY